MKVLPVLSFAISNRDRLLTTELPGPDTPPPNLQFWADPRYRYSLVKGSPLDRRLGYLATFLLEEKIISKPVNRRQVLDASVIVDALKRPREGQ